MKVSRKKTRKFLLQKLYARIYGNIEEDRFSGAFFDGILDFQADYAYIDEMSHIIIDHQNELLDVIKAYAPKFDLDTMLKTNILSMCIALAEMIYLSEEIPAKVSINEAIDLAKYFWDNSSKAIVNGILNSILTNIKKHQNTEIRSQNNHHFFCEK